MWTPADSRADLTDTLQPLVEDLALDLGRSVAVDDTAMRLIAASAHYGDEDPLRVRSILDRYPGHESAEYAMSAGIAMWTEAGRLAPRPDLGLIGRICAPIRHNGLHLGYLWIIDADRSIREDQLKTIQSVADACGALLYRRMTMREHDRETSSGLLRGLVSPSGRKRSRSAQLIDDLGLWADDDVRAVVLLVEEADEDTARVEIGLELAVDRALRALTRTSRLAFTRGHRATILVGGDWDIAQIESRILVPLRTRFREAAGPGHRVVAGLGPTRQGLLGAHESHDEAQLAARAALRVPGVGDNVSSDSLGYLRLLLQLPSASATPHSVLPRWSRLVDRDSDGTLRQTLYEFLARAGNVQDAAEHLRVHRTTLYHRIARVEQLLELDLRSGDARLELHLALHLERLSPAR